MSFQSIGPFQEPWASNPSSMALSAGISNFPRPQQLILTIFFTALEATDDREMGTGESAIVAPPADIHGFAALDGGATPR